MTEAKKKAVTGKKQVRRISLSLKILFVYVCSVTALVFVILYFKISLAPGSQYVDYWLPLVWFIYYGLPVFLAVIFGLAIKPFWRNFRNLLVGIIFLQILYSFFSVIYRTNYLAKRTAEIHVSRKADVRLMSAGNTVVDRNKDGRIDNILFSAKLDVEDLPPGKYKIWSEITQNGQEFPDGVMGNVYAHITPNVPWIKVNYMQDPRVFEPYYANGPFEINIKVAQVLPLLKDGRKVLAVTRWAPYFRTTSWSGQDPEISEHILDISQLKAVDRFSIMPLKIDRPPIKGTQIVQDYGRDDNGNGRFETIVLVLSVESTYEGPVFFQALIEGSKDLVMVERDLARGNNQVEIPISAKLFSQAGINGPYELTDIRIYSRDPECTTGECAKRIKPFFTLPLENYLTQSYRLNQLE